MARPPRHQRHSRHTITGTSTIDDTVTTMATNTSVRVGVRVRPLTRNELGGTSVLQAQPPSIRLANRSFTYDSVFHEGTSQTSLYQAVHKDLLESFLEGYNATVS